MKWWCKCEIGECLVRCLWAIFEFENVQEWNAEVVGLLETLWQLIARDQRWLWMGWVELGVPCSPQASHALGTTDAISSSVLKTPSRRLFPRTLWLFHPHYPCTPPARPLRHPGAQGAAMLRFLEATLTRNMNTSKVGAGLSPSFRLRTTIHAIWHLNQ